MDLFFVSPKESVLIGLCVGEYLDHDLAQADQLDDYTLHGFFQRRLGAFLPTLRSSDESPVGPDHLPSDLHWVPVSNGELGISSSHPVSLFSRRESGVWNTTFKTPRRSLFDLMVLFLGKSMQLSPEERFMYAFQTEPAFAARWELVVDLFREKRADLDRFVDVGTDNPEAISSAVETLIRFNECEPSFRVGTHFGQLASRFDSLARWVFFCDGDEEEDITAGNLRPILDELLSADIVARDPAAKMFLEKVRDYPPSLELRSYQGVEEHAEAQRGVWLAFGQLLANLQDADLAVKRQDWASATPRAFQVTETDTPDKVRAVLSMVEQDVSERPDGNRMPEDIVQRLASAVECITRRVWPQEFSSPIARRETVSSVLHGKLRSTAELEARFASIALTLYRSYRNPLMHDFDRFACTIEEARFFVAGIRTLLDLAERLTSRR